MKKVSLLAIALVLSLLPQQTGFAATEDEQWPIPNEFGLGHHLVLIEEQLDGFRSYSQLTTMHENGNYLCKSVVDQNCSKGWFYDYNAVLPVCETAVQINCLEGLSAITESGDIKKATFDQYTYVDHPNMYVGDLSLGVPMAGAPSIWKLPGMPHAGGDEYAVITGLDGVYHKSDVNYRNDDFYLSLYPVSRKTGIQSSTDINGYENYSKCIQRFDANGRGFLGCGGGAQELGNFRCAVKTNKNGDCYLQRPFPTGARFEVSVRLAKEPISWLHGRMLNPTIDIAKLANGAVSLKVQAGSVRVPIFYFGSQYSSMSSQIKKHWDECLPARTCGFSTRIADSNFWKEPNGNLRNVQDYATPFGDRALQLISTFTSSAADKSVAVPSAWNIRSLTKTEMAKANGCFSEGSGVKGIVTTNSTTYSEGPPTFKDGMLNYKVASAHFNPDGTEFKGTYNLVMRSDVARCLYKFSSAPLSASIEVISESGQPSISTTVFGERKGWVELAAYNFGFSAPTVRVKLSQEVEVVVTPSPSPTPTPSASAKPAVKTATITCVKGKTSKKVTAVKPKCPAGFKKK
jgi:hypothetical protein